MEPAEAALVGAQSAKLVNLANWILGICDV
jgi:hypothetical protein